MAYARIITASIVGADGPGKSDLLWTLPTPSAIFHIDPNTEENFEKAVDEKRIKRDDFTLYKVDYPNTLGSRDDIQDEAEKIWDDQLVTPLKAVLDDRDIVSIGLDTGTELFELRLMHDHGKAIQILPEMRTPTNYAFKGFMNALKRSGKHTVWLHRSRDSYADTEVNTQRGTETRREKVQGVYEREGFSRAGYHVNVEAFLIHAPERSAKLSRQFGMRVSRCTARPGLKTADSKTKEFWDLDDRAWWWGREKQPNGKWQRRVSFPYLAVQMYPDTTYDDWK